jgi:hypothetical protein
MIHALQKRRLEQMQREEILVGIVASTTANFSMGAPKRPLRAEDFMLHPIKNTIESKAVTAEEIRAVFAHFKQPEA